MSDYSDIKGMEVERAIDQLINRGWYFHGRFDWRYTFSKGSEWITFARQPGEEYVYRPRLSKTPKTEARVGD